MSDLDPPRRRFLGKFVATACALAAAGCTSSGPPPAAPAEPAEVVCDVCGKPIAAGRLQAAPESVLCIDDARAAR